MVGSENLSEIPFFHAFDSDDLGIVGSVLHQQNYLQGSLVFRKGNVGDTMFFLGKGRVDVIWEISSYRRFILASIGTGSFFGEMALLEDSPRSATVMAVESLELFSLARLDFYRILQDHPQVGFLLLEGIGRSLSRRLRLLNEHLLFTDATLTTLNERNKAGHCTDFSCNPDVLLKGTSEEQTIEFLKVCGESKTVAAGDVIIEDGDNHDEFYVILEGAAQVSKLLPDGERVVLTTLGPGNILGEMAFLDSEYRSAEVKACEPMTLCVYRREHMNKLADTDMHLVNKIYLTILRHISLNIRLTNEHYIASKKSLLGLDG